MLEGRLGQIFISDDKLSECKTMINSNMRVTFNYVKSL